MPVRLKSLISSVRPPCLWSNAICGPPANGAAVNVGCDGGLAAARSPLRHPAWPCALPHAACLRLTRRTACGYRGTCGRAPPPTQSTASAAARPTPPFLALSKPAPAAPLQPSPQALSLTWLSSILISSDWLQERRSSQCSEPNAAPRRTLARPLTSASRRPWLSPPTPFCEQQCTTRSSAPAQHAATAPAPCLAHHRQHERIAAAACPRRDARQRHRSEL